MAGGRTMFFFSVLEFLFQNMKTRQGCGEECLSTLLINGLSCSTRGVNGTFSTLYAVTPLVRTAMQISKFEDRDLRSVELRNEVIEKSRPHTTRAALLVARRVIGTAENTRGAEHATGTAAD